MRIIPYVEVNGAWTFTDSYLLEMWDQMVSEGTAKKVFFQGKVTSGKDLIKWCKSPANEVVIGIGDNDQLPLIFTWLNGVEDRRAWFNFNIFKRAWGKDSHKLAVQVGYYYLYMKDQEGNYIFDVLIGLTPSNNRLALQMVKKMGATSIGEIPLLLTNHWTGKRVGGVFSYFLRGDFDG
jgi:hypothetical protein